MIILIIIESVNLFFNDPISFFIFLGIIFLLLIAECIVKKQIIYDLYKKEYTLDGEKNKLKVKKDIN